MHGQRGQGELRRLGLLEGVLPAQCSVTFSSVELFSSISKGGKL
jgi:hypothetical protein